MFFTLVLPQGAVNRGHFGNLVLAIRLAGVNTVNDFLVANPTAWPDAEPLDFAKDAIANVSWSDSLWELEEDQASVLVTGQANRVSVRDALNLPDGGVIYVDFSQKDGYIPQSQALMLEFQKNLTACLEERASSFGDQVTTVAFWLRPVGPGPGTWFTVDISASRSAEKEAAESEGS